MADLLASFALFVSCVEGLPVTRFGTGTLIGASRSTESPTRVDYDPAFVVAIPHDEYDRHRRAYDRALGNGSLAARTAKDFQAQLDRQSKLDAENRAKAKAAAKAAPSVSLDLTDPAAGDPPA